MKICSRSPLHCRLSAISKYSRALDFKPILDSFFGKFALIFTTGIASLARIG